MLNFDLKKLFYRSLNLVYDMGTHKVGNLCIEFLSCAILLFIIVEAVIYVCWIPIILQLFHS